MDIKIENGWGFIDTIALIIVGMFVLIAIIAVLN